jgi:hypothetical protein
MRFIIISRAHLSCWNLRVLVDLEVVNGAFCLLDILGWVILTVHANDLVIGESIFILISLTRSKSGSLIILMVVTRLLMFV